MKKILLALSVVLIIGLVGCTQIPVYNPPIQPVVTTPSLVDYTPIATEPPTVIIGVPANKYTPTPTVEVNIIPKGVVPLPIADYPIPPNNLSGIGKPLKQIEMMTAWLKVGDLDTIGSTPIYNAEYSGRVFSLTYGIFETRDNIIPAPAYFKSFVSTYSLVYVPARSWVDVPVVFKIPKGTENLPTVPVYFNIAVHDTFNNGNLQFQAAERWEVTLK